MVEEGNADRVRGIVHALRLVRLMMSEGPEAKIESAVRDALIVPETKPLDDLLTELQRQRSSVGVVVDEYGRTVGIVTVEDILEEVVGEIEDETDPLAGSLRQLANGDWYVRGHVSLGDLSDRGIELPVDTDAYNSVGGYVFGELGRLPKRGDLITADGFEIRVESVRENRIEAVRIHARSCVSRSLQEFSPSVRLGLYVAGNPERSLGGSMWVVRFSDKQLEVVRAVLRSEEHRGPALEGALEALDLARWDDLPEAQLPWAEVEAEASKQGVSEADVIWDRSGRHDEPAVPKIATKSRVKRKGKQAA